jgi:hypothetical protein
MRSSVRRLTGSFLPLLTLLAPTLRAEGPISFNRQIQPILSEYCYHCHGPDAATRKPKKAPLRLDAAQFAFEPRGDEAPAIIKGDPGKSALIQRLHSTDPDDVMPPPESLKQLKPEEKALLEQWVAEGAKYEMHWSYLPPVKPPRPAANGTELNEIDHFVTTGLAGAGLAMNPPESRARAFRRLSYDLTGLPPAPETLQAYLADNSPEAWEKAADRLLATDACAEHFTRQWLDTVRYGDTHGIHIDNYRSIWPYRDWVIRSFKANQPFDQFTIDQMAGDLLPNATTDQKTATGYNRCMPTTGEGGAIGEEYDAVYAKDRADTMGAVWLGLTVGCATCHDHKFDPIPTKDFYSLTAFFRNTPMSSLDGNNAEHPPVLALPTAAEQARLTALPQEIAAKKQAADDRRQQARAEFEPWLAERGKTPMEEPAQAALAFHFPLNEAARVFHGTSGGEPAQWTERTEPFEGMTGSAPIASGQAVSGRAPAIARDGKASYGLMVRSEAQASGAILSRMDAARAFRGWDLFLSAGRPAVHIVDQWPDKALKVTAKAALTDGAWHHLMVVFDGTKAGAEAVSLYADGVLQAVDVEQNSLGPDISVDVPVRIGARSRGADALDAVVSAKVTVQDVRIYNTALSPEEIQRLSLRLPLQQWLATDPASRTEPQKNALFDRYALAFDQPGQLLQKELAALAAEQEAVQKGTVKTLVMEEKKEDPFAFVLARGDYRKPTDRVTPATPSALPPMDAAAPRNRLGLAQWLVSKENPLTARVTVNRVWGYLFGTGIVETTEDLGISGARPVNQDLLDWQAVAFMESGWDYRAMVKRMILSQAYRQSAALTPAKLEKDPLNLLISRGPRYRLDAEQIRDGALAAAGLLVPVVGGPPVRPYQPDGVWEAVAMPGSTTANYQQDRGEGLYRRSMYTLWKRTAPPASMDILNAPSRETFCTRRERTNTPLQAFVTMNDPQFVEASRQLAALAMASSPDPEARLDFVTTRLLSRAFTAAERAVSQRTRERAFAAYQADAAAAQALITVGDSKPDASLPPAELATWTLAVSQILNMDESLSK